MDKSSVEASASSAEIGNLIGYFIDQPEAKPPKSPGWYSAAPHCIVLSSSSQADYCVEKGRNNSPISPKCRPPTSVRGRETRLYKYRASKT